VVKGASAAKADIGNVALIAAVNRCASQRQEQDRAFSAGFKVVASPIGGALVRDVEMGEDTVE